MLSSLLDKMSRPPYFAVTANQLSLVRKGNGYRKLNVGRWPCIDYVLQ